MLEIWLTIGIFIASEADAKPAWWPIVEQDVEQIIVVHRPDSAAWSPGLIAFIDRNSDGKRAVLDYEPTTRDIVPTIQAGKWQVEYADYQEHVRRIITTSDWYECWWDDEKFDFAMPNTVGLKPRPHRPWKKAPPPVG